MKKVPRRANGSGTFSFYGDLQREFSQQAQLLAMLQFESQGRAPHPCTPTAKWMYNGRVRGASRAEMALSNIGFSKVTLSHHQ